MLCPSFRHKLDALVLFLLRLALMSAVCGMTSVHVALYRRLHTASIACNTEALAVLVFTPYVSSRCSFAAEN